MTRDDITILGSDNRQLDELLREAGYRTYVASMGELTTLTAPLATQPTAIVLDIRGRTELPGGLALFKRQHPGTGVVIVAARFDPALMLEAMRAGVTEWVADPVNADDLTAAITRVTTVRGPAVLGRIFAFVGAKGGVGTTTMAVNVATALARSAKDASTLYMDLHLSYGDSAVFFGAEPRFSVADAMENTHRLDEAFFRSLVTATKTGVDLLASSERATSGADLRRISMLLQFAASMYRYTVLDVPRSEAVALEALEGVSLILVVANQELATVRNAGRMAGALRQRYGKDRVGVVVTRYDKQAEIGPEDVQRVIGLPVKHLIPSDYRAALQALNKGRPLGLDNHSKLAAAYQALAFDMAGLQQEKPEHEPAKPTGLFGGLFGGRQ